MFNLFLSLKSKRVLRIWWKTDCFDSSGKFAQKNSNSIRFLFGFSILIAFSLIPISISQAGSNVTDTNYGTSFEKWRKSEFKSVPLEQLAFSVFFSGSTFIPCEYVNSLPLIECKKTQNYMMYITTLAAMVKNFGYPIYGHTNHGYTVYRFDRFAEFYGNKSKSYLEYDQYNMNAYDISPLYENYKNSRTMTGATYLTKCLLSKCKNLVAFKKNNAAHWAQIWSTSIDFFSCAFESYRNQMQFEINKKPILTLKNAPIHWYRQAHKNPLANCGSSGNFGEMSDFISWNLFSHPPKPPSF